ncbi:MAG: DNA gyrase subunit A [Nitrospirae bacterium]|nr:DNA gyrase subunit A [Nitrospirota bacterium]NTW65578.1 DNA gyrase subunit A [Nitrospirota bacterium]
MEQQEIKSQINIEQEMKTAYLDYSMSVIVGRALPDVRDGLKPVHRRILYAMFREGLLHNKKYSKSAGVVGEVLKKYHPHGDSAVYDTMVRMAQDFNMRYPLVDGQGNFGSIDGDSAAAYRYTEARLTKLAEELLADIDKETVEFVPNFDDTTVEPSVLPTRVPNLLINGSAGIAVGMATNIPPHNLGEVVDGLVMMIDNHEVTIPELMTSIKGPDFPTAGFIHGYEGIRQAYMTGRGIVQMRARVTIEEGKGDRESIVITELPYQVNKARLLQNIGELIRDKKINGIAELRDESDRQGMRVVADLKKGEIANVILNQLYKHTALQSTFGVIMLALVNNQPRVLNLKRLLSNFIQHRREVVVRRTKYDLRKAEERAHILLGLKIALENLDAVIALIKASGNPDEAKAGLVREFKLSEIQAQAILEMRLQRLTGLERDKIIAEYEDTLKEIARLNEILASDALVMKIIRDELLALKTEYGDARRTEILAQTSEIGIEDLIKDEEMVITISHAGYIKRNPLTNYRAQRRGGKGKVGMETREEDFVERLFMATMHSYILFFTNKGRVYWLKVHQIPEAGRQAKGKAIVNLLQIGQDERVTAALPVREFTPGHFILMATKQGIIKKTELDAYSHPRPSGIIAITLEEGDDLIGAEVTDGKRDVFLGTKDGLSIRFNEEDVREIGRTGKGVIGVRLDEGNEVVGMEIVRDDSTILTVTENGFGKRSSLEDYRSQSRGGKGIITIKTTAKNGRVVAIAQVSKDDEILLITGNGKILRTRAKDISVQGRNTQGVRLLETEEGDKVKSLAKVVEREEEKEVGTEKDLPTSPVTGNA